MPCFAHGIVDRPPGVVIDAIEFVQRRSKSVVGLAPARGRLPVDRPTLSQGPLLKLIDSGCVPAQRGADRDENERDDSKKARDVHRRRLLELRRDTVEGGLAAHQSAFDHSD